MTELPPRASNRARDIDGRSFLATRYSPLTAHHTTLDTILSIGLPRRWVAVEEAEWLPAARAGESWALERFFHAYQGMVFALCHRLLSRTEDAEDATQATFIRAFRELTRFRGESALRTWIYRIAVNEALGMLRRRREVALSDPDTAPCADRIEDAAGLSVRLALARVAPEHRAVLVLRYWEGLSTDEIAGVIRLSPGAVRMRLLRARREFRRWYEEKR